MAKVLRRSFFFAALMACAWPVRADPLLMFVFSVVKEIALAHSAAAPAALAARTFPATYPGTTVEPTTMRRLIDESFTYLSQAQRDEIFLALNAELLKPENIAVSAPLIDHFAHRAVQVRAAQERLARLSSREQERLLLAFPAAVKSLSREDLGKLRTVLELGLLPVPSDLSQQMLVALD